MEYSSIFAHVFFQIVSKISFATSGRLKRTNWIRWLRPCTYISYYKYKACRVPMWMFLSIRKYCSELHCENCNTDVLLKIVLFCFVINLNTISNILNVKISGLTILVNLKYIFYFLTYISSEWKIEIYMAYILYWWNLFWLKTFSRI